MVNPEPRVPTPGPDVTKNLMSSDKLVREQAKATILSATKDAGGSQQQAEQLISTLVSCNIYKILSDCKFTKYQVYFKQYAAIYM